MAMLDSLNLWLARRELHKRRSGFYYDLGSTLQDRVPLVTTLSKLHTRAKIRKPGTALMYLTMLRGLQLGSFSNALEGIASPVEQTLIDATQAAGDEAMADGLLFMSETVEKTDLMVATMRKAVVYPLTLLLMFVGMMVGFAVSAVPILAELMPPEKWPFLGRMLYAVSSFLTSYGIFLGLGFVTLLSVMFYSMTRWTGSVRAWFDRRLPYSIYRDYSGSMLLISLSSMMRSGISLRSALERAMKFSSPWMRWHIRKILVNLSKPNTPFFGQAFSTGLLTQELEDRVQDASERRDPVAAFVRMGVGSIDRMVRMMEQRSNAINRLMILICGVLLAFMMAGFFSTTMSLQQGIKDSSRNITGSP
jgi:hypothetical protein